MILSFVQFSLLVNAPHCNPFIHIVINKPPAVLLFAMLPSSAV